MASKTNENYQRNSSAEANQTLVVAPITTNEDAESIKGRFFWKLIAGYYVPYSIRVINGVQLKFVSVRMAETQLLNKYLNYLHDDIYKCTSLKRHLISDSVAKLLNDINYHADYVFGFNMFFARKDYIVLLENVDELHAFIEVCFTTLLFNINTSCREKCGFICINSESFVPYCIKDNKKYVPLFCFEGETENLQHLSVEVENWNLVYLKFCCKIQGIKNEYFTANSCTVISLDDIKNCYEAETTFEEYWPPQEVLTLILKNQNSTNINAPYAWIRAPTEVIPVAENSDLHTLTASAPDIPQNVMNIYQNRWPANQMINSYSIQTQPPSTTTTTTMTTRNYFIATRNQSTAAQSSNADSTISQGSSLINNVRHVVLSPPLICSGNIEPAINNSVSYSNLVPISQCMTTIYNPMSNSNVMSHSNQMQQLYSQCANNNSESHPQLIQQHQHQQQQQQQIITTQTALSYSGQSVHGCLTNIQLHNTLRNVGPILTSQATESIVLSPQPCNPTPPTIQETSFRSDVGWKLTRIPERIWENGPNFTAYKVKRTLHPHTMSLPYKRIT